MQSIYFFGTSYIIPNVDTIVCGGTAQINDWNTKISDPDTKKIMGDIYECFPEMENSELVRKTTLFFIVIFIFIFIIFII